MIILGIETSCDETAAAVVEIGNADVRILSNIIVSQIDLHKDFGGVVPESAAREHLRHILPVIDRALSEAGLSKESAPEKINKIVFASRPGLITSLLTGEITGRILARVWGKEFCEVDHIESHICANFYNSQRIRDVHFPAVALTVSGGHTNLVLMRALNQFENIGFTLDDAAGEAFDKAAKMLELGYPGGPVISKLAAMDSGDEVINLPRPMLSSKDFNFSFSGLKTAFLYALQKDKKWRERKAVYAHSVEDAITDVLVKKTIKAANQYTVKSVLLSGGVSANVTLRKKMQNEIGDLAPVYYPPLELCTDNAAMVAIRGGLV